jgi:hypothetical protein
LPFEPAAPRMGALRFGCGSAALRRIDALHFILKSGLRARRGLVCKERRRLICQRMLQVLPFEF